MLHHKNRRQEWRPFICRLIIEGPEKACDGRENPIMAIRSFNHPMAIRLCRLAELVYGDSREAKRAGEASGMSLVKWSWRNQGATHAALWEDAKAVYLAFCGTNDWTDMLTNVSFLPLSHDWGRVHRGFLAAVQRVEN